MGRREGRGRQVAPPALPSPTMPACSLYHPPQPMPLVGQKGVKHQVNDTIIVATFPAPASTRLRDTTLRYLPPASLPSLPLGSLPPRATALIRGRIPVRYVPAGRYAPLNA